MLDLFVGDSLVVYLANAFDSRLRDDQMPLGSSLTKSKNDFLGWPPVIAFLYLLLFRSPLRVTPFLPQNETKKIR